MILETKTLFPAPCGNLLALSKDKVNQYTRKEVIEKLLTRPDTIGMIHGNVEVGNETYGLFMAVVPNA
jgi:hypothetical protein